MTDDDFDQLRTIVSGMSEFLQGFVLIGYDLEGNRIDIEDFSNECVCNAVINALLVKHESLNDAMVGLDDFDEIEGFEL